MRSKPQNVEVFLKNFPEIDADGMGRRLAAARHEKNLDQAKVSKDIGISVQYVSAMENGKKIPSLAMLVTLANYYNTTTDYILTGRINKNEEVPGASDYMGIVADLKPREREVVMKVAKAAKEALRGEKKRG